jgi:(p)ppGpp synthase/HD superfamily hydrolase
LLSRRFTEAVDFAVTAHGDQTRKGGSIPYVAHLLGVAGLVLEAGGDEDLAIAGLLHDTIEDTETSAGDIEGRFGARITSVVVGCTDTDESPKPPWRDRKERFLARLGSPETSPDVLLVCRADKLHNARSMLLGYRAVGESFWDRFSVGPDQQLWYATSVVSIFAARLPGPMTDELARAVAALGAEVAGGRRP